MFERNINMKREEGREGGGRSWRSRWAPTQRPSARTGMPGELNRGLGWVVVKVKLS